ncbi:3-oxoadipate enol-lactonase 2 [subsurface metagenome]
MRTKINHISLNYELVGSGKCIVLTHGLGGALLHWEYQVPEFSKHYQVMTWDVRGFGHSDKPAGPYSAEMFATDLCLLLKKLNIERVFVHGHSMGGVIAQRFALDYPEMTMALIISHSSSEVKAEAIQRYNELADIAESRGMEALPITPPEVAFAKGFIEKNPKFVTQFQGRMFHNDPKAYAAAARAMGCYNYTEELAKIGCPTLIIVGDQDLMTPPGGSVIMHRRIPGSELVIFKDCGHISFIEQPEVYNNTILRFLAMVK